jgi:hypothetical protein
MSEMIFEDINYDFETELQESIFDVENGRKVIRLKSVIGLSNAINKNRRVYPSPIFKAMYEEVKSGYSEGRPLLGNLDHPTDPQKSAKLLLEEVAVRFDELIYNEESGKLTAIATPTETPKGEILAGLIRSKVPIGFSTRCSGSVKPGRFNGQEALIVNEGCKMISCDAVAQPSIGIYSKPITESYEGQKYYYGFNNLKSIFERIF